MEERLHGTAPTGSGAALAVARGTQEAERQEAKRRASAEVLAVLAVEAVRVPGGVVGGRVTLAARGSAATLTAPAHRFAFARESEAVAEEATTDHYA